MIRFVTITATAVISAISFYGSASAAPLPEIRFCVATPGGNYAKVVAPKFAEQVGERYTVKLVTTKGSPEILDRLSKPAADPEACDWGAAQLDAFALSATANDVQIEAELYPEFLHFACRRDVEVYNVKDVLKHPDLVIGTGSAFSGNTVAWKSLTKLDKKFDEFAPRPLSTDAKAAQELINGTLDCVIAVTGWKSKDIDTFINLVDEGETSAVTLRSFWDDSFAKRTVVVNGKSRPLYTKAEIPEGIYNEKFQPDGGWFSDASIATVSVPAVLLSRPSWMENQSDELKNYLAAGVVNAKKVIAKQMSK